MLFDRLLRRKASVVVREPLLLFAIFACILPVVTLPLIPNALVQLWLVICRCSRHITQTKVSKMAQTPAQIAAVAFDPRGEVVVAGLVDGQCVFYNANTLTYKTSVKCKNRYGSGKRITGCQFDSAGKRLLVTTHDSNVRLISMSDFTITMKFKGTLNRDTGTIRAFFSGGDERHIICGSQSHNVYIWRADQEAGLGDNTTRRDRHAAERAVRRKKFVDYNLQFTNNTTCNWTTAIHSPSRDSVVFAFDIGIFHCTVTIVTLCWWWIGVLLLLNELLLKMCFVRELQRVPQLPD